MKRMTNRTLVLAMGSALAFSASAVGQDRQEDQATPPAKQTKQQSSTTEADRDAGLSAQAHAAAAQAMFQRMDADGDGQLTAEEMAQGPGGMAGAGSHGSAGHPMAGQGMAGQGMGPALMDSDGDGAISAAEHAAMAQAMFQRMDADGDGRITTEEMGKGRAMMMEQGMPGHGPGTGMGMGPGMGPGMGMGMSAAERITLMDRDGDGRISASEHAAGTRALFSEADTDKDGVLSTAERTAHRAKMMQRVQDAARQGKSD